jgi:hypothetical protein
MPYIFYFIYSTLIYLMNRRGSSALPTRDISGIAVVGLAAFVLMVVLYQIQYTGNEQNTTANTDYSELAFHRLFGANFDMLTHYMNIYAETLPWGYGASFRPVASLLGVPLRDYSIEVVGVLNPNYIGLTTYPTVFVGAAWADFAWPGVVVYSLLVGFYVRSIDLMIKSIRIQPMRFAVAAVCMVNIIFLLTAPVPVSLLTYGLLTLPLLALLCQIILTGGSRANTAERQRSPEFRDARTV